MTNIVTLDEVRAHLRFTPTDTMDDMALQLNIDAADEVMLKECGDILPRIYEESHNGGATTLYTKHRPILSVESIVEGWGWANYPLDYVQVNSPPSSGSLFAYSIDIAETGEITRRTAGNVVRRFTPGVSNIDITYTAGRYPIPPIIRLAELELISFWWRNSQERVSQQSSQYGYGAINEEFTRTTGQTSANTGVPWAIIEMLKPYRASPVIG